MYTIDIVHQTNMSIIEIEVDDHIFDTEVLIQQPRNTSSQLTNTKIIQLTDNQPNNTN